MDKNPKPAVWSQRLFLGTSLRTILAIAPTLVTAIVVIGCLRLLPDGLGLVTGTLALFCVGLIGIAAATITSKGATRLLPLAALLKLSLAFPDQSPSRFRLAMKASSSRRLAREVSAARRDGLSSDAGLAAEQVLLLTTAVGEHDRKTRGHSERVRVLSRLIGEEIGLDEDQLTRLQWAALLHDIGKLTVPSQILNKPSSLSETEWAILHQHPDAGRELIAPLDEFLGEFAGAADGHHERWDGTGYPKRLAGKDIPLAARIVAVADAFEVMTSVRAYKKPLSAAASRAELTKCAGSHFDPKVVRALLNVSIGPLRWATGPVALAMGLPIVGEFFGFLARAGFHVGGTPAAAAAMAPATATAGALSMAAATGAVHLPTVPPEATTIIEPIATTTTIPNLELVLPTTTLRSTTTAPTTTAPTTTAPTTAAPTTTAARASTTAPTTAAPTTAAPTTAAPTTTTAAPTTTAPPTTIGTTVPPGGLIDEIQGLVSIAGPLVAGTDLSSTGAFQSNDTLFVFLEPVVTLGLDLVLGGETVAAGSTVCPHLVVFTPVDDGSSGEWEIGFRETILGIATTAEELTATDVFSALGVIHNTNRKIDAADTVKLTGPKSGEKEINLSLQARAGRSDSVRIFVACDT